MFIFQSAADSILASDKNKSPEFGGERFKGIDRVEVDGGDESPAIVTLRAGSRSAVAMCLPTGVYRPKDRAFQPADVHDSVRAAMLQAHGELTGG